MIAKTVSSSELEKPAIRFLRCALRCVVIGSPPHTQPHRASGVPRFPPPLRAAEPQVPRAFTLK
jgi:hypothetical protein